MVARGPAIAAIAHYMVSGLEAGAGYRSLRDHPGRRGGSELIMSSIGLCSSGPETTGIIRMGQPLALRVSYSAKKAFRPVLGVGIKTVHGAPIFNVSDRFARQLAECVPMKQGAVVCAIEELDLLPGTYTIDLWLGDEGGDFDMIQDAMSFEVVPADLLGTGRLPPAVLGPVFRKATWRLLPNGREFGFEPDRAEIMDVRASRPRSHPIQASMARKPD